ncbi:hypothetical protein E4O05_04095 [Treponema sp. OMZ 787]|uniref:hypothetical protein n=1 Tax=Treponema sp. OMZ 787 TaxID=2563669 RepID=UPI0020A4A773|nr:hypothetical protein [Treponema sp. OMZ 787]UTC63086.1 hypothetical protein E4O05_04095 [Treponema sp. OMZ 787]
MDSGIFITDNRLKFSQELANKLRDKGLKVCLSSEYKEDNKESGVTTEIEWNRSSLFSLQAIPLKLKNINIAADTSILIFDAPAYSKIYSGTDALSIDRTVSDLISANAALSLVLKNYYIKKAQGRVIFVHRDADVPCGNPNVSAASAAFARIAEETVDSVRQADLPGVQTLLVKLEGFEDEVFAEWICNQLDSPVLSRSPGRWVKAGQRGFFGK